MRIRRCLQLWLSIPLVVLKFSFGSRFNRHRSAGPTACRRRVHSRWRIPRSLRLLVSGNRLRRPRWRCDM